MGDTAWAGRGLRRGRVPWSRGFVVRGEARHSVDVVAGSVSHDRDAHAAGRIDPDHVEGQSCIGRSLRMTERDGRRGRAAGCRAHGFALAGGNALVAHGILLEDLADAAAAREALAEPGDSVPWEHVRAEAGL